jgi:uncharacterized protein (TIGR02611 family)
VSPDDEVGSAEREKESSVADPTPKRRTPLERIRSTPTGRMALRVFIGISGLLVVALGALLIPLPGPGWLIVIGGLAIWSMEFHWAKRLLHFTRRNVQAWTGWAARQSLPLRMLIGAVGLVFVACVVWLSVRFSLGIDLIAVVRGWF